MTNIEIREAVRNLQSLEELINQLTTSANEIKSNIKQEMRDRETEVLNLGNVIIRNTTVLTNRFDTTGFKKINPDLYNLFIKQVVSHKFTIAG